MLYNLFMQIRDIVRSVICRNKKGFLTKFLSEDTKGGLYAEPKELGGIDLRTAVGI